jgi:hypothetical protein
MSDELENVQQPVEQQAAPVEQQENEKREEYHKADEASKQESLRALRETAERERRLREEAERKLEAINSVYNKMQPSSSKQEDPGQKLFSINDDDYVEGRVVKHLVKEIDDLKKSQAADLAEIKVKSRYPDFDKVAIKENIEKIDPSIARSILANNNIEERYVALYQTCKIFSSQKNYAEEENRIENNRSKARSAATVSPLSHLNEYGSDRVVLTAEQKMRIMEENEKAIQNRVE